MEVIVHRPLVWLDVAALLLSLAYMWIAFGYERGTLAQPGPGLYPQLVGVLLVIASICSLVTEMRNPAPRGVVLPKGRDLGRVISVTAGAGAYVALLNYAGHLLSSILVVFIVLHTMGMTSWPMKIGVTIAIALGSYYLFDVVLMVSLPRGILQ